jgi:hypothetical protein
MGETWSLEIKAEEIPDLHNYFSNVIVENYINRRYKGLSELEYMRNMENPLVFWFFYNESFYIKPIDYRLQKFIRPWRFG